MHEEAIAKTKLEEWTVVSARECFSAPPFVTVVKEVVVTPAGVVIDDFYRVDLPAYAICVPFTEAGQVVGIWQYKHGPRRRSLTFPAGLVERGELPLDTCQRELEEETGFVGRRFVHVGEYVDSGNQRGSVGNYFVAHGCEYFRAPCSNDLEQMEIRLMTVAEVDAAVADGSFAIVAHLAAWLLATRVLAEPVG